MLFRQSFRLLAILAISIGLGCATKHTIRTVTPGAPDSYAHQVTGAGVIAAADPFSTSEKSRSAFSMDVTQMGYFPILLVLEDRNESSSGVMRSIGKSSFRLIDSNGPEYSPVSGTMMATAMTTPHKRIDDNRHLKRRLDKIAAGEGGDQLDVIRANFDSEVKDNDSRKSDFGKITISPLVKSRRERAKLIRQDFQSKELLDAVFLRPGEQTSGFVYFKIPNPRQFHGRLEFVVNTPQGEHRFSIPIEP